MNTTFEQWFQAVREECEKRGVTIPAGLSGDSLYKWQVHYENMLTPLEAVYNMVELANTQIGLMQSPADMPPSEHN